MWLLLRLTFLGYVLYYNIVKESVNKECLMAERRIWWGYFSYMKEMKRCKNCGKTKPKNDFFKDKASKDGCYFYCKECIFCRYLKSKYNMTLEQYNKMFEEQRGICAVCGIPAEGLKYRLAVDHNHITGKIRGLLCFACNTLLGRIENNPRLIPTIMKYLRTQNKAGKIYFGENHNGK